MAFCASGRLGRRIDERRQASAVRAAQTAVWRAVVTRFREREARDGLKQADIARRLGVSRPQIHEWLSDPRKMTLKAAARLMLAMDAPTRWRLSEDRDGPGRPPPSAGLWLLLSAPAGPLAHDLLGWALLVT